MHTRDDLSRCQDNIYHIDKIFIELMDSTGLNCIMCKHNTIKTSRVHKLDVYMIPGCPLKILDNIFPGMLIIGVICIFIWYSHS